MALPGYIKPFLSLNDQVALLLRRGMTISDTPRAMGYLERLGYYRLSGYWYPMRTSAPPPAGSPMPFSVLDDFLPGTEFGQVVDLYVFDKRLRLLFLDAIERVEVALRVKIAMQLGARDPYAHRNPSELDGKFTIVNAKGRIPHTDWIAKLDESASRSREEFSKHFNLKYAPPLPIWIAIELWDFGLLSTMMSGMKWADVTQIAAAYGIPRAALIQSWCRSMNNVRNICAHHARLWNRPLVDFPRPPRAGEVPMLDHLIGDINAQSRPYAVAAFLQYLLKSISPASTWSARLKAHFLTFPTAPGIAVAQTGFPRNWEALPLWN